MDNFRTSAIFPSRDSRNVCRPSWRISHRWLLVCNWVEKSKYNLWGRNKSLSVKFLFDDWLTSLWLGSKPRPLPTNIESSQWRRCLILFWINWLNSKKKISHLAAPTFRLRMVGNQLACILRRDWSNDLRIRADSAQKPYASACTFQTKKNCTRMLLFEWRESFHANDCRIIAVAIH